MSLVAPGAFPCYHANASRLGGLQQPWPLGEGQPRCAARVEVAKFNPSLKMCLRIKHQIFDIILYTKSIVRDSATDPNASWKATGSAWTCEREFLNTETGARRLERQICFLLFRSQMNV